MYTEDTFFTDILCPYSSASNETLTCYLKTNLRLYIYIYIYIYIYTHTHIHTCIIQSLECVVLVLSRPT